MIKLFQGNIGFQLILILLVLVMLWIQPLINTPIISLDNNYAIGFKLIYDLLKDFPSIAVIISMVIILIEGFAINIILANVGLVSQNSLLPTFLFVLISSINASTLTPYIIVNAAMILCLYHLMLHGTLLTIPLGRIFSASMFIGLASLFYQPAILFIVSYVLVAINYRLYNWKDWSVMILGLLSPYFILLAVFYLNNGIVAWWENTKECFLLFGVNMGNADTKHIIASCVLCTTLLWGVINTVIRQNERPVLWQKNSSNFIFILIGTICTLFFQPIFPLIHTLFAIPFSFCVYKCLINYDYKTRFGQRKKYTWTSDVILLGVIISAFLC